MRTGSLQLNGFEVWRRISSWNELVQCEDNLDSVDNEWIFRGLSDTAWSLDSTLERVCAKQGVTGDNVVQIEEDLLIDFWRHYDLYSDAPPPNDDDTLAWLSLMRHYGTPTRLTDFTRSLFIAAYFALEEAAGESAIWAVSKTWLTRCTQALIKDMGDPALLDDWGNRVGDAFDRIFFRPAGQRFVSAVSPAKMHERLAIQQSIFLCPADVSVSFLENLRGMPDSPENVRPVVIDTGAKEEILLKLMRIGIDRSSLFPGLEGFAQSMRSKILTFKKLRKMESTGARFRPNLQWATKRAKRSS